MNIFHLPDLGEGLVDAQIQNWQVQVGDTVLADQIIVLVETAKAVVEVPSPYTGTVSKLYGQEGDMIQTGQALIAFNSYDIDHNDKQSKPAEQAATVAGKITLAHEVLNTDPMGIPSKHNINQLKATPAVRYLAQQHGINLQHIKGSGLHGIISQQDVLAHIGHSQLTIEAEDEVYPVRGTQRRMAQVMMQAQQTIVPVTLTEDANVAHWSHNTDKTVAIIRAIITACKQHPKLNSYYDPIQQQCIHKTSINLGLAIDTPNGLYVPVLKNAAHLSHDDIRTHIEAFKHGVRKASLDPQTYQGATFTLSNFGSIIGRYANPIVTPPQVAILGVGRLRLQPTITDGSIQAQAILPVSLTVDHRVITGGEAAHFLKTLIAAL